jgi:hypothetical protein
VQWKPSTRPSTERSGGDQARARSLRKALQEVADDRAPEDPLREMAREVLSGRMGLREAARVPTTSSPVPVEILRLDDNLSYAQ